MRIHRARICGFKGLDVEFPWALAVVLFGANDSGKTNILESFASNLGAERAVRTEPSGVDHPARAGQPYVDLDVELDGLDIEGHPDQEIFLKWLLADCVEGWWEPDTWERHDEPEFWDEEQVLWAGVRADFARLEKTTDRADAVARLVDHVRALAHETRERHVAFLGDAERLEAELGGDAFQSRRFKVRTGELRWVLPGDRGRVGTNLADFTLNAGPRSMESFHDPLGVRVIRVKDGQEASSALHDRLEHLLERLSQDDREGSEQSDVWPVTHYVAPVKDPWVERIEDSTKLRPITRKACASLSARVNDLAPQFVSEPYEISVVPLFPDEWHARGGRHVAVRLRPRLRSEDFDLAVASSGIAAWTSFALSEAIRLTEEELAEGNPESGVGAHPAGTTVYVLDEPEAHLHPLAQEQAAAWVTERALAGAHVLLATHAVPFLNLALGDVEYLMVARSQDWWTRAKSITGDILGAVAESAADLGLPPVALIQLTRAWLVVEGEHDRKVLDAFYRRELRQARIRILPLRGAARAKASFLNLEALAPLGLPFFCLLDNTRAEAIKSGQIAANPRTEEEKIAEQIWRLYQEKGVDVDVRGLPYPDIICALPIEAVRHVARENGGKPKAASAWRDLIDQHQQRHQEATERGEKAPDFKRFVLESLGLHNWNPDRFVMEALQMCGGQPPQASPLSRIVAEVVASVDARPLDAA